MLAEKLVGVHGADLLGTSFFENALKPNYDTVASPAKQ